MADRPLQRVVVLKDQKNKKAHEESAQLACEAAASIRTVASLTRENDCLALYSRSLEQPLRESNRTAVISNGIYSFSQAAVLFVIALVFWYGSTLVADLKVDTFGFFVGLMVRPIAPLSSSMPSDDPAEQHVQCNPGRERVLVRAGHLIREGGGERHCDASGLDARDRR